MSRSYVSIYYDNTRAITGKPRKPSSPSGLCGNAGRFPVVSETDFRFQEGKKVAPAKARLRVPYTKNSLSLVHEYSGMEAARLG